MSVPVWSHPTVRVRARVPGEDGALPPSSAPRSQWLLILLLLLLLRLLLFEEVCMCTRGCGDNAFLQLQEPVETLPEDTRRAVSPKERLCDVGRCVQELLLYAPCLPADKRC